MQCKVCARANYIWRNYYNFTFLDTVGFEPSDFTARPYNVNVSAFYNARQGYPFEPFILVSRGNGVGNASVLLDNVGTNACRTIRTSTSTSSGPSHGGARSSCRRSTCST